MTKYKSRRPKRVPDVVPEQKPSMVPSYIVSAGAVYTHRLKVIGTGDFHFSFFNDSYAQCDIIYSASTGGYVSFTDTDTMEELSSWSDVNTYSSTETLASALAAGIQNALSGCIAGSVLSCVADGDYVIFDVISSVSNYQTQEIVSGAENIEVVEWVIGTETA